MNPIRPDVGLKPIAFVEGGQTLTAGNRPALTQATRQVRRGPAHNRKSGVQFPGLHPLNAAVEMATCFLRPIPTANLLGELPGTRRHSDLKGTNEN